MPIKVEKEVTYTMTLSLPCTAQLLMMPKLADTVAVQVSNSQINDLYREIKAVAKDLEEVLGKVDFSGHVTTYRPRKSESANKILEYAKTHSDFTRADLQENLSMPKGTASGNLIRLVAQGKLIEERRPSEIIKRYHLAEKIAVQDTEASQIGKNLHDAGLKEQKQRMEK